MLHGRTLYWQWLPLMNGGRVSTRKKVLAIDDEPEVLDVIKQCLEAAGFEVLTALTPKEGLELYEKHQREIGVVLLDFLMPGMTGDLIFECMQRMNASVRVILLTGCEDNVARRMFETGLRGYIQKPFYFDDLVNRVREELDAD